MGSIGTPPALASKVVLSILLVSVVVSGIPAVELHAHENAKVGHSHDAHEFFDDHGVDQHDTEDGDTDTATLHVHSVNATSVSLITSLNIEFAVPRHSHSHIPPPYSRLPDDIVAPFYRPPIV